MSRFIIILISLTLGFILDNNELYDENEQLAKENEELKHKLEQLHGTVDYWKGRHFDSVVSCHVNFGHAKARPMNWW